MMTINDMIMTMNDRPRSRSADEASYVFEQVSIILLVVRDQILTQGLEINKANFEKIYIDTPQRHDYLELTWKDFDDWEYEYRHASYRDDREMWRDPTGRYLRYSINGKLGFRPDQDTMLSCYFGTDLRLDIGYGNRYHYRMLFMPEFHYLHASEESPWLSPHIDDRRPIYREGRALPRSYFTLSAAASGEACFIGYELGALEYTDEPEIERTWTESTTRLAIGAKAGSLDFNGLYLIDSSAIVEIPLLKYDLSELDAMGLMGEGEDTPITADLHAELEKTCIVDEDNDEWDIQERFENDEVDDDLISKVREDLGFGRVAYARLADTVDTLTKENKIHLRHSDDIGLLSAYQAYLNWENQRLESVSPNIMRDEIIAEHNKALEQSSDPTTDS